MFTLYTDAATDNNTTLSAAGILILHNGRQTQLKAPLPNGNNHQAEFHAAITGFEELLKIAGDDAPDNTVLYYTDSKIVADSVAKQYAKHYQPLVDALMALQAHFSVVVTNWIPEKQNQAPTTWLNRL
ncbi:ribonuclease HI family protein [Secundilactobacillus collinoides]|uniref:ribonuclease HI family protein n=1 Tax=Secundilactobacillus collinoides TaxID=33960 RepID=UPI0006D093E0|nr:ribonuclease HI family protein [Secundilactobacillus collinoides]